METTIAHHLLLRGENLPNNFAIIDEHNSFLLNS